MPAMCKVDQPSMITKGHSRPNAYIFIHLILIVITLSFHTLVFNFLCNSYPECRHFNCDWPVPAITATASITSLAQTSNLNSAIYCCNLCHLYCSERFFLQRDLKLSNFFWPRYVILNIKGHWICLPVGVVIYLSSLMILFLSARV